MLPRESWFGLGALAAWLMLFTLGWPMVAEDAQPLFAFASMFPSSMAMIPVALLVLLRIGAAATRSRQQLVRRTALAVWLLHGLGWGLWIAASLLTMDPTGSLWVHPWLRGIGSLLLLPVFPVCTTATAAFAWWVCDRLDAMGLDGAFVLLFPQAAVVGTVWMFELVHRVQAGILSPWHSLGSPLLPLMACAALLLIRPLGRGSEALGAWGPRSALPVLLCPFWMHQVLAWAMPESLTWIPAWLGVGLAAALIVRTERGARRPTWLLLLIAVVPVQVAATGLSVWGSGVFEQRYGGTGAGTWVVRYDQLPTPRDLACMQARIDAAHLDGSVEATGPLVRMDFRDIDVSRVEWWIRRVGARPGEIGVHTIQYQLDSDERVRQLTAGSDKPWTWAAPPDGTRLVYRGCPGKDCDVELVGQSLVHPDEVLGVEPDMRPLDDAAWIALRLAPAALERLRRDPRHERWLFTVDERIYGRAHLQGELLLLPISYASWAPRLARRLAPGALDLPDPVSIDLQSSTPGMQTQTPRR